jgi:ABC-type glycerol-3-phosphate transport system substrate-binding protein
MKHLTFKRLIYLVVVFSGLLVFFSCKGRDKGSASVQSGSDGDLKYKGTITFYAQSYTPLEPTETNPTPPTAFKKLADKYSELHPGINIEFDLGLSGDDVFSSWIRTKMAAGQAPDIFWMQYIELNGGNYPLESFIPVTKYLEKPNKYVSGNAKWIDLFPDSLISSIRAPNGEINNINGDYVGIQLVYNVRMFKEAGIDFKITDWSSFTKACELLKAKGYTPWQWNFGSGGGPYLNWVSKVMSSNLYYPDLDKLAVLGNKDAITLLPIESIIAIKNGYFTSKDPRFLAWWPAMKEHVEKYMPKDTVSQATDANTIFSKFINQEIAMYWDGTWADNNLQATNCSFEYASNPLPYPDKFSMTGASDFNSSGAAGGYQAAFQYAISSKKANMTLTDDKLEAVVDWLMYISTPENNEYVCNDLGSFLPVIKGTTPTDANKGLVSVLNSPVVVIDIGLEALGGNVFDDYYRELQSYVRGTQTLEQAGTNVDRLFSSLADARIAESGIDVSKYLNK